MYLRPESTAEVIFSLFLYTFPDTRETIMQRWRTKNGLIFMQHSPGSIACYFKLC